MIYKIYWNICVPRSNSAQGGHNQNGFHVYDVMGGPILIIHITLAMSLLTLLGTGVGG